MQKYTNSVTNINSGRPVPNASILVTDSLGATATIYSNNGVTTQTNPIVTGADGEYSFYAANGRYTVAISANGFTGESISDILLYDPAEAYADDLTTANLPISVKDFGAVGDGVADDYAAFCLARDSVASGAAVHIVVPRGTYYLSAPVLKNGRKVQVTKEDGVTLTGPGYLYLDRTEQVTGTQKKTNIQGDNGAAESRVLGDATYLESNGTDGGYGAMRSFTSYRSAVATSAGDIGFYDVARWLNSTGTGLWAKWTVSISPITAAAEKTWGLLAEEQNPVDNGPDRGYTSAPGAATWSGGHLVVPDVWAPSGSLGGNIVFAHGCMPSPAINARGPATVPSAPAPFIPRSYNGYMVGLNSIAPDGRGVFLGGSDSATAADHPNAPAQVLHKWKHGIRTDGATLTDNLALLMGSTHALAWVDGSALATNGLYSGTGTPEGAVTAGIGSLYLRRDGSTGTVLYVKSSGTGNTGWVASSVMTTLTASGQVSLGGAAGAEALRALNAASTVNRVDVAGSTAGNAPSLTANGSDADVGLLLQSKNAGAVIAQPRGLNALMLTNPASAVNYWQMFGAVTTGFVGMQAQGTDSNVGITVSTKGTSPIVFQIGGTEAARMGSGGVFSVVGKLGYATGAGGTIVQATSKATGVTLDKASGQITMHNASLAANTAVSFTLTNNQISATDTAMVHRKSGGTANAYRVEVDSVAAGSCVIRLTNLTAGALAESVVLQFAVIAGVIA
jgi:hypothetical protein